MFPAYWTYEPTPSDIRRRLAAKKLCLTYSERRFKKPVHLAALHYHLVRPLLQAYGVNSPFCHYLAIGAYAAWDQRRIGMFKGRQWTFGYFAPVPNVLAVKPTDGVTMCWAGEMTLRKRAADLLAALAAVRASGRSATCFLAGDGPERPRLEEQMRTLGLERTVVFLGRVGYEELQRLLRRVHIVPFTSDYTEGWGMVINEAMAAGCCVIASLGAGATRVLLDTEDRGLTYEPGDRAALAAHLIHCIDNPTQVAAKGHDAWRWLLEHWSPAVAADRLVGLVEQLLEGKAAVFTEGVGSPALPWRELRTRSLRALCHELTLPAKERYEVEW